MHDQPTYLLTNTKTVLVSRGQWRRKEIENRGPPVAYLESAKGDGRGPGGRKSPRSWSFVVNEWL